MRGILMAGTCSDAGKSLLSAGLCRALARRGVRVAPFKAQNMSNNSMVCADGSEIGRAQFLQAQAAGVEAESAMNPVLLKPGSDRVSHVVLRGRPAGVLRAGEYTTGRAQLAEVAFAAHTELAARFDVVVCEGAGSPAEINLRNGDYTNMGLARAVDIPVALVADIDRGGALASLYGTWGLLDAADRALLDSYVINKFRGDANILEPGLQEITRRTGMRHAGTVGWLQDVWFDGEDALEVGRWRTGHTREDSLTVAVARFPRISNTTDVDALAAEPGVHVVVTTDPDACAAADLLVLPGTRATLHDLAWLHERGISQVVARRAVEKRPVLGICGGHQMLGEQITDGVELAGSPPTAGLGLLPHRVTFEEEKTLARSQGSWEGVEVSGYEIHHGRVDVTGGEPFPGGVRVGEVFGTLWHGALEGDVFRRRFLTHVATATGSRWLPDLDAPGYGARREDMLERLADAMESTDLVTALTGHSG